MGGNAGVRGYIIQTIICMLDALEKDNKWLFVTLEPLDESEKVDIRWVYPDDIKKVTQVKSSQNVITYANARKWSKELESNSPDATDYELILIGSVNERLLKREDIGKVKIGEFKPLNTEFLIDQASTKIDSYYERKGKDKISSDVREIIVNALNSYFGNCSIIGYELSRDDFDKKLLEWIRAIEHQIENNVYSTLAPSVEYKDIPLKNRITKKILELIGWGAFGDKYEVEVFNERTSEVDVHAVDFEGDLESKLKENTGDFVMVSSLHDIKYPESSKIEINKYINDTAIVLQDLKKCQKVPTGRFDTTDYYSLLFWFTTDNNDLCRDFIHEAKENYKRTSLNDELNYFLIDNKKANFLISSIITAKNYRVDVPVKFMCPITEANQSPDSIGSRSLKLPVQYINSSVIPIAKEDKSKISFLLFCSDGFSPDSLKKLIWLTIRLTSGFGNEYLLYFPDYDEERDNSEALRVIRSFDSDVLENKIEVLQYNGLDVGVLDSIPKINKRSEKNEIYEVEGESLIDPKHINEAFINILPYGDILKPFLNTKAIIATDILIFLAKKGVFVKNAEKSNLINLMSTMLFSPAEIEDFKSLIDVKERSIRSTNVSV